MKYADLEFRIRFTGAGSLPPFRGTTVRGAFGYALKRVVCIVHHRDCTKCLLRHRCAFPAIFEGLPPADRVFMRKYPQIPQPIVLRVDFEEPTQLTSETESTFGFRLFGPAIEFYPYVVYTVMRMGTLGLGRDRVPFSIVNLTDGNRQILTGEDLRAPTPHEVSSVPPSGPDGPVRLALALETPLRMRTNGTLNPTPTLPELVRTAVRRVRVLSHFYGQGELQPADMAALMASAEKAIPVRNETRWHEIRRHSARQNTEMALSGVVGRMEFILPDRRVVPWLEAACVCHLGKATSFGYGRLSMKLEEP